MIRVQFKRGEKLPKGAVYVGRPTMWGNPFKVGVALEAGGYKVPVSRDLAVDLFRAYATDRAARDPKWLSPLRGHDLACWCPLDQRCHADILLRLAADGV